MYGKVSDDRLERLIGIKREIRALADEALSLVRGTDEEDRAQGYWYAHIVMSLDKEQTYFGRGGETMQQTIDALSSDDREGAAYWP